MYSNKLNTNQKQFLEELFVSPTVAPKSESEVDSNSEPSVRPKIRPIGLAAINSYIQPSVRPKVRTKAQFFVDPNVQMIAEPEMESNVEECVRSPAMRNSRRRVDGFDRPFRLPKTPHNLKIPQKTRFSLISFESIIEDMRNGIKSTDKMNQNNNSLNKCEDKKQTKDVKTSLLKTSLMDSLDEIRLKNPSIDFNYGLRRPLGPNILDNSMPKSVPKPEPKSVPTLRKPKLLVSNIFEQLK